MYMCSLKNIFLHLRNSSKIVILKEVYDMQVHNLN